MPRDDKEREWYMKAGFLAPTTGLKGISQRLEELGYKVLDLTSTALTLQLPPGLNTSAQWNIGCLPERNAVKEAA
jgi:Archaeal PaREP1/PaREP8 family.